MARPRKSDVPSVSTPSSDQVTPAKRRGGKIKWTEIPADLPIEEVVKIAQGKRSGKKSEVSEIKKSEKIPEISKVSKVRKPAKAKTPPDTHIDGIADGIAPAPKRPRKKPATGPSGAPATAQPIAEPAPKKKRGAPVGNTNGKANKGKGIGNQNAKGHGEGRPPSLPFTPQVLADIKKLAAFACTQREAACFFDVTEDVFDHLLRHNKIAREAWEMGGGKFNASLRRKQVEVAMTGNVPMLIFLGKNRLKQVDKVEYGGDASNPIQVNVRSMSVGQFEEVARRVADAF